MKEKLLHNLGLKILSIVLAALLWLTIMNIDDPVVTETISNVPVKIINDEVITSRGYQYEVESGARVDVKVKGKRSVVDNLDVSDFQATADFNSLNSMYMASISIECTSDHASELVLSLKTETMAIKLEDQEVQPFSIKVVRTGNPKEGYYCYETKAASSLVQVTGSKTQMAAVKEIVATVDIEGKASDFTSECELVAFDASGNEMDLQKLNFSQDTVDVSIGICSTKSVSVNIVAEGEPAEGFYLEKVEYAPQVVQIAAEDSVLRLIDEITVNCDISGASGNIDKQINLADYLSLAYENCYAAGDIDISAVFTVKPMTVAMLELNSEDIEVRNVGEGLKCEIYFMWNSNISVKGSDSVLENLTAKDLNLYIDVNECGTGTYSRQVMSDYEGPLEVEKGVVMIQVTELGN